MAFCSRTPPYQRAHHSMDLDVALGKWLPVVRNTWWPCYRTKSAIYRRHDDMREFEVFEAQPATPGFFKKTGTTVELPLDSHPIQCQTIGRNLWTHRKLSLKKQQNKSVPAGHEHHNTLNQQEGGKMVTGSDGSVHLNQRLVASAWMATANEDQHRSACFLLTNSNSISSYRSELEGVYRLMRSIVYWGLKPSEVEHWCDNERSVISTQETRMGRLAQCRPMRTWFWPSITSGRSSRSNLCAGMSMVTKTAKTKGKLRQNRRRKRSMNQT